MNKDFLDFLMNSMPISTDAYNYLTIDNNEYVNVGLSPLYKDYIKAPFRMEVEVGDHIFIAESNKPVYLIEDTPELVDYAIGTPLKIKNSHDPSHFITVFPKFRLDLEEYLDLKIEEGNLYYMNDQGQWIHDAMDHGK